MLINNTPLTDEAVITKNKMIAEFMGYTYFPHNHPELEHKYDAGWKRFVEDSIFSKNNLKRRGGHYLCRNHTGLDYHRSYDSLMKVVDKIESLNFDFSICRRGIQVWKYKGDAELSATDLLIDEDFYPDYTGDVKKFAIYDSCCSFIEWHIRKYGKINNNNTMIADNTSMI